jgi:hypothetical protein
VSTSEACARNTSIRQTTSNRAERSLTELAGILTDEEADTMREAVEERRVRRSENLESVTDEMRGA